MRENPLSRTRAETFTLFGLSVYCHTNEAVMPQTVLYVCVRVLRGRRESVPLFKSCMATNLSSFHPTRKTVDFDDHHRHLS